ncbi:hypothetical protein DPMN_023034 [Dreissena polymorpha]|uniref:Uncharacterized protein n=1 Tax=Dreissena polymorpha TaxID=45954 RepID=A0A9D4RAD1_DREPO|nr:hypothetical protein DPMN_023034 [Dreissena polymorpha]
MIARFDILTHEDTEPGERFRWYITCATMTESAKRSRTALPANTAVRSTPDCGSGTKLET